MNTIKPVLAILAFLLLSALQVACATNNCTFDSYYFKQTRYTKNSNVKYVLWEDATKYAKIVTTTGELISVKHWSCHHFGTHAVMLIGPYSNNNFSGINNYFRELSSITLDTQESELVNDYLDKHPISLGQGTQIFRLENNDYSEFYLMLSIVNESVVIEIKYYRG